MKIQSLQLRRVKHSVITKFRQQIPAWSSSTPPCRAAELLPQTESTIEKLQLHINSSFCPRSTPVTCQAEEPKQISVFHLYAVVLTTYLWARFALVSQLEETVQSPVGLPPSQVYFTWVLPSSQATVPVWAGLLLKIWSNQPQQQLSWAVTV